ncbi:uncharacterized protein DUF1573 [Lutibacter sp. Hel_I_33_5]|uniref:DUF1573 domain-containing protein n=1 Tax=Lutibacter sp. Hel_I_33_5 TaxID=1566289 RepID=UPI0011A85205|nr:DUF1573 domain-containing protein [Lutibacter sp. Hel_I_33_5]TVZ55326.1 uncharacterized protein DUF1573 [Lutibacter sp. Hel_I_33_5]
MRKLFTIIVLSIFSITAFGQKAEFKFEKETIDYGKIIKNSDGVRTFTFTNIGSEPLIIKNIQSSCGCTVPKKPDQPILPGQKGEIKVAYDTNRLGGFSKAITIYSNAKHERKVVKIKGFISKGVSLEKKKSMLSDDS